MFHVIYKITTEKKPTMQFIIYMIPVFTKAALKKSNLGLESSKLLTGPETHNKKSLKGKDQNDEEGKSIDLLNMTDDNFDGDETSAAIESSKPSLSGKGDEGNKKRKVPPSLKAMNDDTEGKGKNKKPSSNTTNDNDDNENSMANPAGLPAALASPAAGSLNMADENNQMENQELFMGNSTYQPQIARSLIADKRNEKVEVRAESLEKISQTLVALKENVTKGESLLADMKNFMEDISKSKEPKERSSKNKTGDESERLELKIIEVGKDNSPQTAAAA